MTRADAAGNEIARTAELATSSDSAGAVALVQARFMVAISRPRNWDQVEQRLARRCRSPRFADSAWYKVPNRGEGLSIRFAEEALREAGNISVEIATTYEDQLKRCIRVTAADLETNYSVSAEVAIDKTVERRKPRDGDEVLGQRTNSTGEVVYLIRASDADVLAKANAAASKAIRTQGLRLIRSEILDGCREAVAATRAATTRADPEAARKSVLAAFLEVGVGAADLARYLGHDTQALQPAEVDDLRGIYSAIKSGEARWADIVGAAAETPDASAGAEKVKAALAARKAATPPPSAEDRDGKKNAQIDSVTPGGPVDQAAESRDAVDRDAAAEIKGRKGFGGLR